MQNAKHVSGAFDCAKWCVLCQSLWLQVVFVSHVSMGRRQGKAISLSAQNARMPRSRTRVKTLIFQSLTVNHFSALPGSFLSLLQAPERRMSLLGFQICSRTSLLLQQLYHRNRHPALRSYGNEMITYLLIFWDVSYFIKGNYSLPFWI